MYKSKYINDLMEKHNDYLLSSYTRETINEKKEAFRQRYSAEVALQKMKALEDEALETKTRYLASLERRKDVEYSKVVKEINETFTGDKIHSDIRLLENPLFKYTTQELQLLADKHKNNPVMQKAISTYADNNNLKIQAYNSDLFRKLEAIDTAYNAIKRCTANEDGLIFAIYESNGLALEDELLSE